MLWTNLEYSPVFEMLVWSSLPKVWDICRLSLELRQGERMRTAILGTFRVAMGVLLDRQKLPVAQGPVLGSIVAPKHPDFS